MLLRASGEISGIDFDVQAVTDAAAAPTSRVEHAEALVALAEAMVGEDDEALARARAAALEPLGPEGLVDAIAVASNFERMVRIADSTGIPLDTPLALISGELRDELELGRFGSSANTPATGALQRTLGRALRPVLRLGFRLTGRGRR